MNVRLTKQSIPFFKPLDTAYGVVDIVVDRTYESAANRCSMSTIRVGYKGSTFSIREWPTDTREEDLLREVERVLAEGGAKRLPDPPFKAGQVIQHNSRTFRLSMVVLVSKYDKTLVEWFDMQLHRQESWFPNTSFDNPPIDATPAPTAQ